MKWTLCLVLRVVVKLDQSRFDRFREFWESGIKASSERLFTSRLQVTLDLCIVSTFWIRKKWSVTEKLFAEFAQIIILSTSKIHMIADFWNYGAQPEQQISFCSLRLDHQIWLPRNFGVFWLNTQTGFLQMFLLLRYNFDNTRRSSHPRGWSSWIIELEFSKTCPSFENFADILRLSTNKTFRFLPWKTWKLFSKNGFWICAKTKTFWAFRQKTQVWSHIQSVPF